MKRKCSDRFVFGDPSESRTPDTMIKSHVLYLLSYRVIQARHFQTRLIIISQQLNFVKIFNKNIFKKPIDLKYEPIAG